MAKHDRPGARRPCAVHDGAKLRVIVPAARRLRAGGSGRAACSTLAVAVLCLIAPPGVATAAEDDQRATPAGSDKASAPASQPPPPTASASLAEGEPGYTHPAKLRVRRARVLREDRELDVFAPLTSRALGEQVEVEFRAAGRTERFGVEVSSGDARLDRVRFRRAIPRAQASLGTGILTLRYPGNEVTRPQEVRLRAATNHADLKVQEISLQGDRLSASGEIASRARGVVRLELSYLDAQGAAQIFKTNVRIAEGQWALADVRVPPEIAGNGAYVSALFTGYFERRIRGEMLSYQIEPGETRNPAGGSPADETAGNVCAQRDDLRCPDLRMGTPSDVYVQRTPGGRTLLRSRNRLQNRGDGPLSLHSKRDAGERSMRVRQRLYRKDARGYITRETTARLDFWHIPGQGGYWKVRNPVEFQVWTMGAGRQVVAAGKKSRFCMRDLFRRTSEGPRNRVFPACSQDRSDATNRQGISVGWDESYPAGYFEQYVDVSDLRDGCYKLWHIADPDDRFVESEETNNASGQVFGLRDRRVRVGSCFG
jgi:hypothetical protein